MDAHDDHKWPEDHTSPDTDEPGDDSGDEGEEGIELKFFKVPLSLLQWFQVMMISKQFKKGEATKTNNTLRQVTVISETYQNIHLMKRITHRLSCLRSLHVSISEE